ncbi:hypothetical protein D3C76_1055460 [compost metagenome]
MSLIPSRSANGRKTRAGEAEQSVTSAPDAISAATDRNPDGRMSLGQTDWQKSSAFWPTHLASTPARNVLTNWAFSSSRDMPRERYFRLGSTSLRMRRVNSRVPKANRRNGTKLSCRVRVPSKSNTESTFAPFGPASSISMLISLPRPGGHCARHFPFRRASLRATWRARGCLLPTCNE